MKLFLTSAGFVNKGVVDIFREELSRSMSKTMVLLVAYAQNSREEFYVNESIDELKEIGLENIMSINMYNPIKISDLGNFDVIYVCGGNTFAILDKLRKTGLDNFIIKQVESGAIYVGVSAGSIIAGPSIETAGWGSEGDVNEVGLKDLSGFKFTNIAVFPHFHEKLRSEVEEFKNKVRYQVQEVTNNQAIFVKDSGIKIIG